MTLGATEAEGEVIDEEMVDCGRKYGYLHGNDWHRTEEDANKRAEQMRLNKIVSAKEAVGKAGEDAVQIGVIADNESVKATCLLKRKTSEML